MKVMELIGLLNMVDPEAEVSFIDQRGAGFIEENSLLYRRITTKDGESVIDNRLWINTQNITNGYADYERIVRSCVHIGKDKT